MFGIKGQNVEKCWKVNGYPEDQESFLGKQIIKAFLKNVGKSVATPNGTLNTKENNSIRPRVLENKWGKGKQTTDCCCGSTTR